MKLEQLNSMIGELFQKLDSVGVSVLQFADMDDDRLQYREWKLAHPIIYAFRKKCGTLLDESSFASKIKLSDKEFDRLSFLRHEINNAYQDIRWDKVSLRGFRDEDVFCRNIDNPESGEIYRMESLKELLGTETLTELEDWRRKAEFDAKIKRAGDSHALHRQLYNEQEERKAWKKRIRYEINSRRRGYGGYRFISCD